MIGKCSKCGCDLDPRQERGYCRPCQAEYMRGWRSAKKERSRKLARQLAQGDEAAIQEVIAILEGKSK